MAARRPADPAALTEQWRSLDTMLDKLATRTRGYAAAGDDEDDVPQPAVVGTASALSQLAAMQRERDQLRRLLARANADLRAARAELGELRARAGARGGGRAAGQGRVQVRNPLAAWWLRWWERGR
jgi:hypothetical protein